MRKLQLFVILIFHVIVLASCIDSTDKYDNCDCNCQVPNYSCPDAVKRGKTALAKFTFQCVYDLLESKCKAKICAPEALFYYMAFLAMFIDANSTAFKEVSNFTQLKNKEQINCTLLTFNTYDYNKPDSVRYYFSDNILADQTNPFLPRFMRAANLIFNGNAINYNNYPQGAQCTINGVIARDTYNYVKNAIPCSNVFKKNCTASKLVLASGRYFQPFYSTTFLPAGKLDYTDLDNNTYKVDFVQQCDIYNYTDSDEIHAKVISTYLKDKYIYFMMFIPNKGWTLSQVAMALQDTKKYNKVMSSLKPTKIRLSLPNYAGGTSTTNFLAPLKKRGIVSSYFNADTSSFRDAFGNRRLAYIAAGISTVYLNNTLLTNTNGTNQNECTNPKMELVVSGPAIYTFSRCGVIKMCGISEAIPG